MNREKINTVAKLAGKAIVVLTKIAELLHTAGLNKAHHLLDDPDALDETEEALDALIEILTSSQSQRTHPADKIEVDPDGDFPDGEVDLTADDLPDPEAS